MSGSQHPDAPTYPRCNLCGESKETIHVNICVECVEDTLQGYLPVLTQTLEERYGHELDSWLAGGCFTETIWDVRPEFEVKHDQLQRFLMEVISASLRDGAVTLNLPPGERWKPDVRELAAAIYTYQGEEFRRLVADSLAQIIRRTPTKAAERELIETAIGLRLSDTTRTKAALELMISTTASPLPASALVLLVLRYGLSSGRRPYTGFWEGEIDPVWREIAGTLPAELASLLPEDESSWIRA